MKDYCKTCCHDDVDIGFCDKCYYNHILEEKGIPPTEYEEKSKPITNADRIRSMTDEELAEWIERIRLCCTTDLCGRSCPLSEICYSNAEAPKETLEWLKQEATETE